MILLAFCGTQVPREDVRCVFNHPVVMCCLIWALVILAMGFLFYCYMNNKAEHKSQEAEKVRQHEEKLKTLAFEQEKYWYLQKKPEQNFKKELTDRINELEKEKEELSKQLKKEKEDREETLKLERLQAEHDFYERIFLQFYSTKEEQSNTQ